MPILKKTMFREYDLRGREADDELNEDSMYVIAKGFASWLSEKKIGDCIVGHDARGTSESFTKQFIKGLRESGVSVVDIGTVTTPMGYWSQHFLKINGLAIITASHNPAGWNGVKLGSAPSVTLNPEGMNQLYQIIIEDKFITGSGSYKKQDIFEEYQKDLISKISLNRTFKILVNTGNGTAGMYYPQILKELNCEVIEHFTDVDPTYPNYTPNPDGEAMMNDTSVQVLKNNCQLGFAYDGDGDRFGLVDETGQVIWPDRYLILLSRLVLEKDPGAKIVFDVKVSEALPEDIKAHGGVPIMWKTGHSHIKAKLMEEGAALAGEMSGHIFFKQDYYGFDDAIFASLKLLEYLSTQSEPLSKVIADTPYYISTPTIHVKTTDEDKYQVVEALVQEFKTDGYKVFDVNGARVYTDQGWGLVRASSNVPALVLRFEAKTQPELKKIQQIFKEKLSKFDKVSKVWDTSGH